MKRLSSTLKNCITDPKFIILNIINGVALYQSIANDAFGQVLTIIIIINIGWIIVEHKL